MNAFSQIEQRGSSVDIAFLSGGIWEAMITTATGLVTALCAVSCCKWFEHVSASRLEDMSYAVSILTERARRDEGRTENAGAYGGESGAELQKVQVREKGKESA
jgi:biopolymer transport protein ExbB